MLEQTIERNVSNLWKRSFFMIHDKHLTMTEINYYTQEAFEKLKAELDHLRRKVRKEISNKIEEAREKGDLSENAEYHAAKEEQGLLELKISNMEATVSNARVIDEKKIDTSVVSPLCKVDLMNLQNNMKVSYKLVAESEADVKSGKISVSSPIGKGLLGKVVGDIAEIKVPAGTLKLEILMISV